MHGLASLGAFASGAPAGRAGHDREVLLRLAYPTVTNTFAVLRLLPMSDRDKDVEILALRQLAVLQRHLAPQTVTFIEVEYCDPRRQTLTQPGPIRRGVSSPMPGRSPQERHTACRRYD
jgi:hypothetical protein